MKKIYLLILIVIGSCTIKTTDSELGKTLAGEHLLRKLPTTSSETSSYFILTEKNTMVIFQWTLPDSSTIISSIPIQKVRYKFDSSIEKPFIKFRWNSRTNTRDWGAIFTKNITYIVINCKESDFPFNLLTN